MKLKSIPWLILSLILLVSLYPAPAQAGTYTVELVSGSPIVMGDSVAEMRFRISNTGASGDINEVRIYLDADIYYVSESTFAPSGWVVSDIKNAGKGQTYAEFLSDTDVISPGEIVIFTMIITGSGDINFLAAATDQTDTIEKIDISGTEGFILSGDFPTWQRIGLKVNLTASPPSVGVGGLVVLRMEVTNRSTVSQTAVTAAIPSISGSGSANLMSGPGYLATILSGDHDDAVTTINVGSTSGFPASGSLRIDSEEIDYTGITATSFTGCTRGAGGTTAASHAGSTPVLSLDAGSLSLASGENGLITWTYAATSTGTINFSSSAGNASVSSPTGQSNSVIIGSFTATLAVSPSAVISGQGVTARMTVYNNGTTSIGLVTPSSLTFSGTATATLDSGPSPNKVISLAAGQSVVFEWKYTISGSTGQTYRFQGYATAEGPLQTNTTTSEEGVITSYTVTVDPDQVLGGSTSFTLTFTVTNNGGYPLEEVDVTTPDTGPGSDWTYSSASGGYNGDWKVQVTGSPKTVVFTTKTASQQIPVGEAAEFYVTFSSVITVLSDTTYNFAVTLVDTSGFSVTLEAQVLVTVYQVTVSANPSSGIPANGYSTSEITATVVEAGSPLAGVEVVFAADAGTLSSATAVTNASGEAVVTLTAPISAIDVTATVTATYLSAYNSVGVSFVGVSGPNPLYVGDTLSRGGPAPRTVAAGEAGVTFTLDAYNVGTSGVTLTTDSYFTFTDGTSTFTAFLDSAVWAAIDSAVTLSFGSPTIAGGGGGVDINSAFLTGSYTPTLHLTNGAGWTQIPDQPLADQVTVAGAGMTIERWREVY